MPSTGNQSDLVVVEWMVGCACCGVGCLVVKGLCGVRSKSARPVALACADADGPWPGGGSLRARASAMSEEAMKRPKLILVWC